MGQKKTKVKKAKEREKEGKGDCQKKSPAKKVKGRKNKKSRRMKKKSRKAKKNKSKKNKGRNGKGKKKFGRQAAANATACPTEDCFKRLLIFGPYYGNQARNFFRMSLRAKTQHEQKAKKLKKKGDYANVTSAVQGSTGGGGGKPLTCNGKNVTDKNSTIQSSIATLEGCSKKLETSCGGALTTEKVKEMEDCNKAASAFRTEFLKQMIGDKEFKATPQTMCAAVAVGGPLEKLQKALDTACANADKTQQEQVAGKKACDKQWGACRNAEKESINIVGSCLPPKGKCPNGTSTGANATAVSSAVTTLAS